jgi:Holliday junction resolvasome RuvABC endonuclease subunit
MQRNLILAIDPGVRKLGLAVATSEGSLIVSEVLTTDPRVGLPKRLKALEAAVEDRLRRFRPNLVLLEKTWPTTCPPLAAARRAALLCRRLAVKRRIPVNEVNVKEVRRKVVGFGWASKLETAQVVASYYPELQLYLRQDRAWKERHFQNLFDAVALLIYERLGRRVTTSHQLPDVVIDA